MPAKMVATAELRRHARLVAVPFPGRPEVSELQNIEVLQQRWVGREGFAGGVVEEWRDVPLVTDVHAS